jgi:hypothetical protein
MVPESSLQSSSTVYNQLNRQTHKLFRTDYEIFDEILNQNTIVTLGYNEQI